MIEKNRTISFLDFFKNLQREYIVAELRYLIYQKEKDKLYYKDREMKGKKETIENIALRNNFKNIFNDEDLYTSFRSEIYNSVGLPNFIYRDDEDRKLRRPLDVANYYHKGARVFVTLEDGSYASGKVHCSNYYQKWVAVDIDGDSARFKFTEVTRIF